jgi:hypothetical protein
MLNQHPIIPPPELVQQWFRAAIREHEDNAQGVATRAAQWGADTELEACCEVLHQHDRAYLLPSQLRAARRPKSQSLKEQALKMLRPLSGPVIPGAPEYRLYEPQAEIIRRALEALPDD